MAVEIREITSRAEWLSWRRQCISASRVAALFDAHPYMSRADLAAGLRGVDQGDNLAMRAGRILEPGVAVALAEEHPDWRLIKATTFYVDTTLRFGCTPDYFEGDDRLVQIKTVSPETWEEWRGRPPLAYQLQTLAELMLTERTRGVLAVMVRSRSYPVHCFDVPRHPAAEAKIQAAVAEWWHAWDADEIAAPAAVDGLAEALDDDSHRDLSGDNMLPALLDERETLKAGTASAEKRLKEIDYEIRNRIGSARTAWLPGWFLKFPTINTKEYTVAAKSYRRLTASRTEE
jgi:predicted phage-related endonuclease